MEQELFAFQSVLVVAGGENAFAAQLSERGIPYVLTDIDRPERVGARPDLVLLVNKNTVVGSAFKRVFPDAQIIICRGGGKKGFDSRIIVVHDKQRHDTHWFRGWDGFYRLICQRIEPVPPLIVPSDRTAELCEIVAPAGYDGTIHPSANGRFMGMLSASMKYTDWLQRWNDEAAVLRFSCLFRFRKRRGGIKRVTLPMRSAYSLWGMPIFREEDRVIFNDDDGGEYPAVVYEVRDEEITFAFKEQIGWKKVNSLRSFRLIPNTRILSFQQKACQTLVDQKPNGMVVRTLMGLQNNVGATVHETLDLTDRQYGYLMHDASQTRALINIVGPRFVSFMQGPAGTGKTLTTSLAVRQFTNYRVILLCSHSNKGLDKLLEDVVAALPDGDDYHVFRLGNNTSTITPEGLRFHRSVRYAAMGQLSRAKQPKPHELEAAEIEWLVQNHKYVILGCTMTSLLVDETLQKLTELLGGELEIDVVFIDEASRAFLYEMLPVIQRARQKLIFVGDPDQLGNIDLSPDAKRHLAEQGVGDEDIRRFADGYFTTVIGEQLFPVDLLEINRRSLPVIGEMVSGLFYGGRVISGRFVPDNPGRVEFLDTSETQDNNEERKGTSWYNRREANLVVRRIVDRLLAGTRLEDMAVITPYRGQIELIRGRLRKALACDRRLTTWRIMTGFASLKLEDLLFQTVNTVDAFQGSQRRVIILSCVRSNVVGDIGFNENINRLRVALSRPQDELLIVANSRTFLNSSVERIRSVFEALIAYTQNLGTYSIVPRR